MLDQMAVRAIKITLTGFFLDLVNTTTGHMSADHELLVFCISMMKMQRSRMTIVSALQAFPAGLFDQLQLYSFASFIDVFDTAAQALIAVAAVLTQSAAKKRSPMNGTIKLNFCRIRISW